MKNLCSPALRWLSAILLLPFLLLSIGCSENRADTDTGDEGRTLAPLQITTLEETLVQGQPALSLNFSSTLDSLRSYNDRISIYTKGKRNIDADWVLSKDGSSLYFMQIEPQKDYTVVVKSGLKAKNGQTLKQLQRLEITSEQLPAAVSFSGIGKLIPAGTEAGLPVRSVNVDTIDVEYFKIPVQKFQRLLNGFYGNASREIYEVNSMISDATMVNSTRYELPNKANTQAETKLALASTITQNPGIYVAIINREGTYPYSTPATYFSVSDIGVHLRQYQNQWSIFTSELATGEANTNVEIRILDAKGGLIRSGISDKQGFLNLPIQKDDEPRTLLAIKGAQLAILNLNAPALDISEFELPKRAFKPREYFIYGPRDVYRPGEKLIFNVLLRDFDGQTMPAAPVVAKLRRPNGSIANEQTLAPLKNGLYEYRYPLQGKAQTGSWSLQIGLESDDNASATRSFLVEDFMPERIRLNFSEKNSTILSAGELQDISLQAEYLYGAPAAGNQSATELIISAVRKPLASLPGFEFGEEQASNTRKRISLPKQTLDINGKASLQLPSSVLQQISSRKGPVKIQYDSSVFESGGRPIQRSLQLTAWQQGSWVGIKPNFDPETNNLVNGQARFSLILAERENLVIDQPLSVELIRIKRDSYWEYSADDGWRYRYTETRLPGETIEVNSKNEPLRIALAVEKGYYQLRVTEPSGNVSSKNFRIGQNWWSYGSGPADIRPDKISMTLSEPAYRAGDTIEVQLQAPRPGNGFLIVETSEGVLYSKRISLGEQAGVFTVDIPRDDARWQRHDLRLVSMIAQPEQQAKYGVPMRSLGIQPIPLDRSDRKISLRLDAPEQVEPLSSLKVKLTAEQADETMMVTIAVVDQGVLSVTDFKTPDPFEFFYEARRASVDARDNFADVLHVRDLAFARQRSGGDTEQLTRGGEMPESKILIVSLFEGPVSFDENGVAEVEFDMPDFNGAVRLMVSAFSAERFGSDGADVIVKAPVVTQLSLPRFASFGDQTMLTLDIQNTLEETQTLTLNWTLGGALLYQPAQQATTVKLEKDQKQVIRVPVIITRTAGVADIQLQVSGGEIDFTRQWSLGLRPAYPALSYQKLDALEPGETTTAPDDWTQGKITDSTQLQLSMSALPPFNTGEQWRSLLVYPYGCLEQTTSRARPLSVADEKLQQRWGVKLPKDMNRIEAVQNAINRLQNMQRLEGGFGLWTSDSPEERWLTPYVTEFLLDARERGFDVPQSVLDRAIKRLQYYVSDTRIETGNNYYGDVMHYRFAYRSYAAYVLATQASAPLGTLRQWLDSYSNESKSPLPLVHLAIALKLQGDSDRAAKAMQLAEDTVRQSGYLGDYGSDIRDSALILALNLKYQLSLTDPDSRLSKLSEQIYGRSYLSTQSRDAILQLALALEGDAPQNPWSARLKLAAETSDIQSTRRWNRLVKGAAAADTSIQINGDKTVYVSQTMVAYPLEAPEKQFNGFSIRRYWYDSNGRAITSTNFKTGDFVIVRLEVSAEQRSPDALIVDLLPAGFELENPGLKYSTPLSTFMINGKQLEAPGYNDQWAIKHQEYRDDRFVTAADLYEGKTLRLTYLMRAVTPGRYQVPSAYVEDMYRPRLRAIGTPNSGITIEALDAE